MSKKIIYRVPIRIYSEGDKKLILGLKDEFSQLTLSSALVKCAKAYYIFKKRLDQLEKSITVKYEINPDVAKQINSNIKRSYW